MSIELEKLYVSLVGNGSSVFKMFEDLSSKVAGLNSYLNTEAGKIFGTVEASASETVSQFNKTVSATVSDLNKVAKEAGIFKVAEEEAEEETEKFKGSLEALKETAAGTLKGLESLVNQGLGPFSGVLKTLTGGKPLSSFLGGALVESNKDSITELLDKLQPGYNAVAGIGARGLREVTSKIKEVATDFFKVAPEEEEAVNRVSQTLEVVTQATTEWVTENKELVSTLGLVAGGALALAVAFKGLALATGIVTGVFSALGIKQLAIVAGWALMQAAAIAWTGVMLVLKTTMLAASAAFTVFGGALGIVSALITGLVVAIPALVTSLGLLAAVVTAGATTLFSLGSAFSEMGFIDPEQIEGVTSALAEWLDIIKLIVRAVAVDMDLAWQAFTLGGKLAIEQIKQFIRPLWEYIKESASVIWTGVASVFEEKMNQAIMRVNNLTLGSSFVQSITGENPNSFVGRIRRGFNSLSIQAGENAARLLGRFGGGDAEEAIRQAREARGPMRNQSLGDATSSALTSSESVVRSTLTNMTNQLDRLGRNFRIDQTETETMRELRNQLNKVWESVVMKEMEANAENAGEDVGSAFMRGLKEELKSIDAVVFNSAEAVFRIRSYYDSLENKALSSPINRIGMAAMPSPASLREARDPNLAAAAMNTAAMVLLLKDISTSFASWLGRPGIELAPARL